AALERRRYDVIFMDVQMPEMDGLEATRRLRFYEKPGQHVRIVAMTANALERDRRRCLEAGMDDFVTKPARMSDLVQALLRAGAALGHPEALAQIPTPPAPESSARTDVLEGTV